MRESRLFRILIILAGVMGADGVILAAIRPSGRRRAAGAGVVDAAVSRHPPCSRSWH